MFVGNRFLYASTVVVFTGLILWRGGPPTAGNENVHLGDWTWEAGPPSNRLSFWLEEVPIPDAPLVRGYEGKVRVENLLDRQTEDGTWGYGHIRPLRLNVTFGRDHYVAAVRRVGPDHLLVRFAPSYRELTAGDPFDHPGVLSLRRVTKDAK
jgi:hypothetical protein